MNIDEFKKLYTSDFSAFSITTLDYYMMEGNKLIANMRVIDPLVLEIMSRLEAYKNTYQGQE